MPVCRFRHLVSGGRCISSETTKRQRPDFPGDSVVFWGARLFRASPLRECSTRSDVYFLWVLFTLELPVPAPTRAYASRLLRIAAHFEDFFKKIGVRGGGDPLAGHAPAPGSASRVGAS